jgi:hypothetical protein
MAFHIQGPRRTGGKRVPGHDRRNDEHPSVRHTSDAPVEMPRREAGASVSLSLKPYHLGGFTRQTVADARIVRL